MTNLELINEVIVELKQAEKSRFNETKFFIQHGNTSVMKHCIAVAITSCYIADRFGIRVNKKALIRGALLHDYFLYDWHEKTAGHNVHGFTHPYKALKNAKNDFDITEIEQNVIVRHMFPLTPIPPMCREAWIVCMADKYCSTRETMYTLGRYGRAVKRVIWG